MKKIAMFLLPITVVIFSCRTTKKVQTIQTAITKKDTTQTVKVKEAPTVDSAAIIKNIMSKVMQQKIDFTTFSATIKADYESAADSKNFKVYLYIKKDEAIYLRLVGSFLGISKEGFAVKITKDSVIVLNKIDKIVQYRSLSSLQEVTKIPFDFTTLQDLFIGNPIFVNNNIVSYKAGESQLSVLMMGNIFKHLVNLDNSDYKILHSKLDDIDDMRSRTCDISYSNYENKPGFNFSTYRKISVAEKSKLDVWMDFKQYAFNEPLTYVFNIPKSYKKQ